MAEDKNRIVRIDPDNPGNEIGNTESHIDMEKEESRDRDFWLKTDFTMISETEEAENRILSPDSESVLKNPKQAAEEPGSAHRVGSLSSFGENGYGPASAVDLLGDTKDNIEVRRALAESKRKVNQEAQAKDKNASAPAKRSGSKTAAGVRKIASGAGKAAAAGRQNNNTTIIGVKRIPQTEESARAAKARKSKDRRKNRNSKIRKVILTVLFWILVIAFCGGAFYMGYRLFNDEPVDVNDISKMSITITGFENDSEMADILEGYDLIADKFLYNLRCRIYDADYKAGTYKLSRSYTTEKIINILSGFKAYADGTLDED